MDDQGDARPAGLFLQWAEDQSWRTGNPVRERVLRVRAQLARGTRARAEPKTDRAMREIEIEDGLLAILRAWKVRSPHSQEQHFVVVTRFGTPLDHRAAGRCLDAIVRRAGLDTPGLPKITPHQLRYTFGSLVIDVGEATSRVSRLMARANEAITGSVYAHEIERRDNAERTRASLRAAFASAREASRE